MARNNLYSKTIVWVKITLPLVGLGLLSSIFLLADTPDPDDALPYADVDIDQITRQQTVSDPRFAGIIGDGQEVVLTAFSVTADVDQTDQFLAQVIQGHMDLGEDEQLMIRAALGDINMAAQMATLTDDVVLNTTDGYQVESEVMVMALDVVNMRSPVPVHVTGPGIDVTADTMELTGPDGETILHFNGSVRVLYDPQS